jgi:starch phosphorylase
VTLRADRLLVAFSRRAALYKRADLALSSPRIRALIRSGQMQMVFSGKSHPMDRAGRQMVERILAFAKANPGRVAYIPNYDMTVGRMLTRGADVWLNNPRRPLEASGTSGMKAAMNGVLNVSILDGWWPEACRHGVNGWQFADGREFADEGKQHRHDAACMARVLERDVLPTYYGKPAKWEKMMRASALDTRRAFGMERMLREYFARLYR